MTLWEIIRDLESIDGDLAICAAKSPVWNESSEAILVPEEISARDMPLPYFLEVSVALDVLAAWSYVRGGRHPTLAERCQALIYYAENDAYLLPSNAQST